MSTAQQTQAAPGTSEVDAAMRAFASIASGLSKSYEALAERARHVEEELSSTNKELARKVHELDAVGRRLAAILECLPTGVVVRDAEGRVTLANDAALGILGMRCDELLEAEFPMLPAPAEARQASLYQRPDGRIASVAARHSAVVLEDGTRAGSVEILDDRTEVAELAACLEQQSKMAALGTMAGGIAHEIRNPMNAIRGFASLLERQSRKDGAGGVVLKEAQWTHKICEGVDEVDAIIASMLSFAAPAALQSELLDGPELVAQAVGAVERDLASNGSRTRPKSAKWCITHEAEPVRFAADRIKLRQALRNLIANAVDAQPEGGAVHVELKVQAEELFFRVTDAGPGIPTELAPRLTEPFFTTRAGGTGLGLSLVHTIAQLHGGRLEMVAEPSPLGGAEFLIRIPFAPRER